MKKVIILFLSLCCLIITTSAMAAVITITLDEVPTDLQCDTDCLCDQNWIVSDIILHVTSTTTSEPCDPDCSWHHGKNSFGPIYDDGILLHPGRLIVNLDAINNPITKIEVILEDYCSYPGCSSAAIYNGSTEIDIKTSLSDGGPIYEPGYFIFTQSTSGLSTADKLIVSSCDGHVGEIRITATSSPSSTSSTCGWSCGTTSSTCSGWGCGSTSSTCGWGCGSTSSTCGGWGCGSTLSTCGWSCGTTSSTCSGWGCGSTSSTCGWGCGSTLSTCGGWGCGSTSSTCSGWGCGSTLSTCGWSCGTTSSTCGGWGCGSTFTTCGSICWPLFGSEPYSSGTSSIPSFPPAY